MQQQVERSTGTIKWFDSQRGYGFITADDASEFFCHISQMQNHFEPLKNDRVEFTPDKGRDGRTFARHIVIVKGTGQ